MRIKPLFFVAAGVLAVLLASCSGDSSGGGVSAVAVTKVEIKDKTVTSLTVGETLSLFAEVSPANATVKDIKWSSGDENIAIVSSSGLVKALRVSDSVIIYARSVADNSVYDYITLKINAKEGLSEVAISGPKTLAADGTAELTAAASGSDFDASNITYEWEITSGSEYAKLSSATGSSVTLTGNNTLATDGNVTVKVTASCTEEGKSSTVESSFTLTVAGTSTTVKDEILSVNISKSTESVDPGSTVTLTALLEYTGNPQIEYKWEIITGDEYGELSSTTGDSVVFKAKNSDLTASKTVKVKVTVGEFTKESSITVNKLEFYGIEITRNPSKTSYKVGEEIELAGLEVTAAYSDGTEKDVTENCIMSGFDSSSAGAKTITVSYTDSGITKNALFEVSVEMTVVDEITSVSIKKIDAVGAEASVTIYAVPSYKGNPSISYKWEITSGENYAKIEDSETSAVKLTGTNSTVKDGSVLLKVTASDGTKSVDDTLEITVSGIPHVTKIEVSTKPKVDYYTCEDIDLTGLEVTATYSDGTTKVVTENCTTAASEVDTSAAGTKAVTVSYTENGVTEKASFDVTFTMKSYTEEKDYSTIFKSITSASVEDEKIATANAKGLVIELISKAAGKTTVSLAGTTADGTLEGYVPVTVVADGTITFGNFHETLSTVLVTKITISADVSSVVIGKTLELTAIVKPSNATDKSLTWSSSDTKVATVDSDGVVTGVKAGSATITATAADGSGIKGTIDIAVTDGGNVIGTVY